MTTGVTAIDVALGLAGGLAALYASIALGRKTFAEARSTEDPRTPYDALNERTVYVEGRLVELERQVRELLAQSAQQAQEITHWTRRVDELTEEFAVAETDRDALAADALAWLKWEEDGRPEPPGPPLLTPAARDVLRRLGLTV